MLPFGYQRPSSIDRAVALSGGQQSQPTRAEHQFIAGGTNMLDYMKLGVARPTEVIDLNGVGDSALRKVTVTDREIRLGALARMAEVEDNKEIERRVPLLTESLRLAASRQIRNMATMGGNVLQRTRCEYFREISWPCNKRNPGSGCAALDGFNRQHAVLGTSDACIATYHGDLGQALVALGAIVEVRGPGGRRHLHFAQLHLLPADAPKMETSLRADEVITEISIALEPWMVRSHYLKIRDRQSYAFALASAAVALDLDGDRVRHARIALGGLATVPWRAREAEAELTGKPLTESVAKQAAAAAFAGAKPRQHNAFKVALGQETLVRALLETQAMRV
jgi:xanthine dehydrogenase YagS FAD-binding subunit